MVGTNGARKERENAAWQAIVAVVVVAASERETERDRDRERVPSLLSFFPSKSLECFFCCWVAALVVVVVDTL
jgi:hypothetical protein